MSRGRVTDDLAADRSGTVVTSDELVLLLLVALALVMLAVFLYYTLLLLGSLPEILPSELPRP